MKTQVMDDLIVHSYRLYRDRTTLHWLDYLEGQINRNSEEGELSLEE